jgi:hypothetical protein
MASTLFWSAAQYGMNQDVGADCNSQNKSDNAKKHQKEYKHRHLEIGVTAESQ